MELKGRRVLLRNLEEHDIELFIQMSMSPEIMKHVDPMTYDEAKKAFQIRSQKWDAQSLNWLTLSISDGELKIGTIGIRICDHDSKIAEVGFMITLSCQGQGYGAEALSLVINHCFNQMKLNKLIAYCSVVNLSSYKLLEKCGFTREGCLRQNTYHSSHYVDDYVYGLCQSDL